MTPLKLAALDSDDLEVVSVHLQDAVVKTGDMAFLPRRKRFAMVLNRFDWEGAVESRPGLRRRRAGLHVDRVLHAAFTGFTPGAGERVLNLLAVRFEPGDPPSGRILLLFSGNAALRLDVECIEVALADLGPIWAAKAAPRHDEDGPSP